MLSILAQEMSVGQSAARLIVAALLGALIGLERERHGRPAGLRTHLLVALGAAMAMVVSLRFGAVYGPAGAGEAIRVDPARLAYGVMAGIGFLGAGAIIRYGMGVRGLTTAASLWCAAAIGLGAGFGMYAVAAIATGIVLFALTVLEAVDHLVFGRVARVLTLSTSDASPEKVRRHQKALEEAGAKVSRVSYVRSFTGGPSRVVLTISIRPGQVDEAVDRLHRAAPEIAEISIE